MNVDFSNERYLSKFVILASVLGGIGLFAWSFFRAYFARFRESTGIQYNSFENEIQTSVDTLLDNIAALPFASTLVTFLVWMVIGLVVYFMSNWVLKQFADVTEGVVVSVYYVHPKSFKQDRFWLYLVLQLVYSLVTTILLVGWVLFSFMVAYPFYHSITLLALATSTGILETLILLFASVVGCIILCLGIFTIGKLYKMHIN